jgi:hypothetical protein
MRLILTLSLILLASPVWAAITLGTTSTAESTVPFVSTSHNHSMASDDNFVLVCLAERDTNASGMTAGSATVTVGGVSATLIGATQSPTNILRAAMFYLLSPPTGTVIVNVTGDTGADRMIVSVLSLKGVAQSSTFDTYGGNSSSGSANADINSLPSAVGELGVMCGAVRTSASTPSPDATSPVSVEQIDIAHTDATSVRGFVYTEDGAAPSLDMRVDLSASEHWAAGAISIRPLAVTSSGTRNRKALLLP